MISSRFRFTPNLGDLKIKNYLFLPIIVGDFKNDYKSTRYVTITGVQNITDSENKMRLVHVRYLSLDPL